MRWLQNWMGHPSHTAAAMLAIVTTIWGMWTSARMLVITRHRRRTLIQTPVIVRSLRRTQRFERTMLMLHFLIFSWALSALMVDATQQAYDTTRPADVHFISMAFVRLAMLGLIVWLTLGDIRDRSVIYELLEADQKSAQQTSLDAGVPPLTLTTLKTEAAAVAAVDAEDSALKTKAATKAAASAASAAADAAKLDYEKAPPSEKQGEG